MKRGNRLSLIVRRAQIRRVTAGRRETSTTTRPQLRLVVSNSFDEGQKAEHQRGDQSPPFD
ncbi:Transposase OS=Bosea thiooxidans OX=53254 GN=SAMN05660750_03740 PE=4 SV=1 [Bosea thiooxidans]|jgi:hypothetical protein|uniref:Uncharacterized protein n=1 Tax=Bosea thiooxidans TaxID=53254 RepID=A0A1T5G3I6_9HYPH|nr:hypothetical protein [Bosea thiooxidans]SKC03025.1 hypothetical protein SAMN05660750_03740 [Bosea thiooxidans]